MSPLELARRIEQQTRIGKVGESIAMEYEHARLSKLPKANTFIIDQVSEKNAAAGYDIYSRIGKIERYIEVKTTITNLLDVYITANEIETLRGHGEEAYLYFVTINNLENKIGEKLIEKGKPLQNGFMERFNRSFWEEVLDAYQFNRLTEAQVIATAWMWIYNNHRPHKSLGYRSPMDFLKWHQQVDTYPTLEKDENIEWKMLVENVTN